MSRSTPRSGSPAGSCLRSHRAALLCAALAGCVSYEPEPLQPLEAVQRAVERRSSIGRESVDGTTPEQPPVGMATALHWLREHSPVLRERISAWRAAHARAEIRTPWPDPQITLGPRFGFGDDVTSNEWSAFGQVSLSIPIGDRRDAADALDKARAEQLRTDAILAARDLYLRLRGGLARLALCRARQHELEAFADDARAAVELVRRGVAAGANSALDVALAQLEAARATTAVLDARTATNDQQHDLARLVGVPADRFDNLEAELTDHLTRALSAPLPTVEQLRDPLARNHPELAERRAGYQVAERDLRLQVELQYPDIQLVPNYTGENGDDIHVLQFGPQFQLPLFDGNRKAIASAVARRSQLQQDYDAAAERALADLDAAVDALQIGTERRLEFRDHLLPIAADQARLADRGVRSGALDALRALQISREVRLLRAAALTADLDQLDRWLELEQTVGTPLLPLVGDAIEPGDPSTSWPPAPWPADAPTAPTDPDAARDTLGPFTDSDQPRAAEDHR